MAFLTISSTSALLSHDSANSPSVCLVVSHSSRLVNVLKKASARSITYASSLMIMQAASSSVNFGLNSKPSFEKNSIDFFKSRTARLTKSFRERSAAMVLSLGWIFKFTARTGRTPRSRSSRTQRPAQRTAATYTGKFMGPRCRVRSLDRRDRPKSSVAAKTNPPSPPPLLRREVSRQPKEGEEHLGVEERVPPGDALT